MRFETNSGEREEQGEKLQHANHNSLVEEAPANKSISLRFVNDINLARSQVSPKYFTKSKIIEIIIILSRFKLNELLFSLTFTSLYFNLHHTDSSFYLLLPLTSP